MKTAASNPLPRASGGIRSGGLLLVLSVCSRAGMVFILCALALLGPYLNLKLAYDNPRLVELDAGPAARFLYETADDFFSLFAEPLAVARSNAGTTWSIRLFGLPFTDPVAALSLAATSRELPVGFLLGLTAPLLLALLFGRVFCAYLCPASLLFAVTDRIRNLAQRWFLLPELRLPRSFAWGLLAGGLVFAAWLGHGIWSLLLPYFALGRALFHGLAFGALSVTVSALLLFLLCDLLLGRRFTCRHLCPTGRLLGLLGRRSLITLRRDAASCLTLCHACSDTCPMGANPKRALLRDCSSCGECLLVCPTRCLSIGRRRPNEDERGPAPSLTPAASSRAHAKDLDALLPPVLLLALLLPAPTAEAHHFKGLPHYNYFENYPQVPEEEFLGKVGPYDASLVVYDFQGIDLAEAEEPDLVRLYLLLIHSENTSVYAGPLKLEVLTDDHAAHSVSFSAADFENVYSLRQPLPMDASLALRVTLPPPRPGEAPVSGLVPFERSSGRTNYGPWVGAALGLSLLLTALGARKARVSRDRKERRRARQRTSPLPPNVNPHFSRGFVARPRERLPGKASTEEDAGLGAYTLPKDEASATPAGSRAAGRSRQSVRNAGQPF